MFELVHFLQRSAVVFYSLHVTTTVLEEAQQLVIDDVLVLHVCEDNTRFQPDQSAQEVLAAGPGRALGSTWSPPQALLEGLHAANTSMFGAAPQADPVQVLLLQQGWKQRQETRRQLAKLRLPLCHQLTW